jgi:DNA-binding NarL/FixJ family response regulator
VYGRQYLRQERGLVLVVDKDVAFRELVSGVLTRGGYDVREAATGEDALDAVERERPTLVLLDINLPGMSGYDVCRHLRADYGHDLPIVFISGERTEPFDQVAGLRLGADDYILKPFDSGSLLARLDRLVAWTAPKTDAVAETTAKQYNVTRRELEVLKLLVEGQRPKQIARELSITNKTVATHVQNILSKLDVHSQGQAIAVALQSGLIPQTRMGAPVQNIARARPH